MAAEYANAESINFMATHGRGLICMPIEENKAKELNLHPGRRIMQIIMVQLLLFLLIILIQLQEYQLMKER